MSDFVIMGITVLFSVSGVYISYGIPVGYCELDPMLLVIYMAFGLLVPLGIIIGKKIKVYKYPQSCQNCISDNLMVTAITLIMLYAIWYFIIIKDNIPLIMLIKGQSISAIKVARLQVTHNFSEYYNAPFIFNYRSLVFNYISVYVFSILLIKYLNDRRKYKAAFWIYAIFEIFVQFYATEKASLFYLLIVIIYDIYAVKIKYSKDAELQNRIMASKAWKRIKIFVLVGLIAFVVLYSAFMGSENYSAAFASLKSRLFVSQSSEVYREKIILDSVYGGCLHGAGIPLTIFDSLFNRSTVNLSKEVYKSLYTSYTNLGGGGTAGSIAIFDMYANFGIFAAILIVFTIAVCTGFIDKKSDMWIDVSSNKELPIAFYSMILLLFFQGYLGHYQTFLAFPFIVAPQLLIILIITWMLRRMKI